MLEPGLASIRTTRGVFRFLQNSAAYSNESFLQNLSTSLIPRTFSSRSAFSAKSMHSLIYDGSTHATQGSNLIR